MRGGRGNTRLFLCLEFLFRFDFLFIFLDGWFSYWILSYVIPEHFCVGSVVQFDSFEISVERIVQTYHFVGSSHSRKRSPSLVRCPVLKGCRQTDKFVIPKTETQFFKLRIATDCCKSILSKTQRKTSRVAPGDMSEMREGERRIKQQPGCSIIPHLFFCGN